MALVSPEASPVLTPSPSPPPFVALVDVPFFDLDDCVSVGSRSPTPEWGRSPPPPAYIGLSVVSRKSRWGTRKKRKRKEEEEHTEHSEDDAEDLEVELDFDPRLAMRASQRRRRKGALHWHKQGTFVKKAEAQRLSSFRREARRDASAAKGVVALSAKAPLSKELLFLGLDSVPDTEWWDAKIVDANGHLREEMITNLVIHPKVLRPQLLKVDNTTMPSFLTANERKKIRRMERRAKQEKLQDEIKLGIRDAPEPRLKLTNVMRVLGTAAILDPTAAEAKARADTEKRTLAHILHNAERQLTATERRAKKRRKLMEDTTEAVYVCVFALRNIDHTLNVTKCIQNATQRNLTGCILRLKNARRNAVVVEGGQKNIGKFKRLMLERLNWQLTRDSEGRMSAPMAADNECVLAWTGLVPKRAFSTFFIKTCDAVSDIKDFLVICGVAHYWEIVESVPL